MIDNSYLPSTGAHPHGSLTAQYQVRSDFSMDFNIKTLTIYVGLLGLTLGFVFVGLLYLFFKLRADTRNKAKKLLVESDGDFGSRD